MVLREELVSRALGKDLFVENSAIDLLCSVPNGLDLLDKACEAVVSKNGFMVGKADVESVLGLTEENDKMPDALVVVERTDYKPKSRDLEPDLKFYDSRDVTGKSTCTGSLQDFVSYFRDRFQETKRVFKSSVSQVPVVESFHRLKAFGSNKTSRVVGMVYGKKTTKNGHIMVELEDEDGFLPCLFAKDSPAFKQGIRLLHDEVVAVEGFLSDSLFIVKQVFWPDLPLRQKKLVDVDASIAFMSDIHVGSKFFMQDNFRKMLGFLNGEGSNAERELAGRIKYVFMAGDLVDGVGIYPSQEKHLLTKDIYQQYELFEELVMQIPEHIEVVIIPGNHDAVRLAEPQPKLLDEFTRKIGELKNVHLLGSPSWFEVHGLKTLIYHGTSFDTIISDLNEPDGYNHPDKIAIELLKRRHLSPVYGEKPLMPEKKDYMFIPEPPDIFHFGHVHKNAYAEYRGATIVNAGTWQSSTDLQVRLGHSPTPCRLPLYDFRDASIKVLSFGG